jgi:uncharacterized protein
MIKAGPPLLKFFSLTFVITWTCFITAAALSDSLPSGTPFGPGLGALILLGTFAPSLVALMLTAQGEGSAGVRALLSRLFAWRVSVRWYLFAIGYMATIKLTVALVHCVVTGAWPRFGDEPWYLMLGATLLSTAIGGQAGEEIGWRGYALPRLTTRYGLARASIILGAIWAFWHLPLFFVRQADTYGQSFPVYLLQVTALSVAIALVYWRTNRSLLLTMLMHAAINNTKDIVPSLAITGTNPFTFNASFVSWITLALLWTCAGCFLVWMRRTIPTGASIKPSSL